jgi:hypothetical protein
VWFINFHHTIIYKVHFYWTAFVMSNFKYKHSLNLLFIEYMFYKVVIWCVDNFEFWVHKNLCCVLCLYLWTVLYTETRIVENLRSRILPVIRLFLSQIFCCLLCNIELKLRRRSVRVFVVGDIIKHSFVGNNICVA